MTWMFSAFLAIVQFLYMNDAEDYGEQNTYLIRCGICLAVFLVAVCVHTFLIHEAAKEDE